MFFWVIGGLFLVLIYILIYVSVHFSMNELCLDVQRDGSISQFSSYKKGTDIVIAASLIDLDVDSQEMKVTSKMTCKPIYL